MTAIPTTRGRWTPALLRLVIVLTAIVVALTATTNLANASKRDDKLRAGFAAQALAAGLTAAQAADLQAQVDEVVAARRGTQVSANHIIWDNGRQYMTLVLPGERRARALGNGLAPDNHGGGHYGCLYYYFCTYPGANYTGTILGRYYYCRDYPVTSSFRFRSYINNQTPGTIAVFKDISGRSIGQSCRAYCGSNYNSTYVRFIKPC